MRTVRFLETVTVRREGGSTFEKGSIHTLRHDSANHWVVRGKAVVIPDPSRMPVAAAEADQPSVDGQINNVEHREPAENILDQVKDEPQLVHVSVDVQETGDGDSVDSPPAVEGTDSGYSGVGTESIGTRRRGRPRGSRNRSYPGRSNQ